MVCKLTEFIIDNYFLILKAFEQDLLEYGVITKSPTKCLFTAIMVIYIHLGSKAHEHIRTCLVDNVKSHKEYGVNGHGKSFQAARDVSREILTNLPKQLTSSNEAGRIFYFMITDAHITNKPSTKHEYFPGHVFVIEQSFVDGIELYTLFQSFINKYNLRDWLNHKHPDKPDYILDREQVMTYMEGLKQFFNDKNPLWNDKDSLFMSQLTQLPIDYFRKYDTCIKAHKILFCYQTGDINNCKHALLELINDKIRTSTRDKKRPNESLLRLQKLIYTPTPKIQNIW